MNRVIGALLGPIAVAAGAVGVAWAWTHLGKHDPVEAAKKEEGGAEEKSRVTRLPTGESVLTLDAEEREHAGVESKPLEAATWKPTVEAYGALEEDPALSFALRAPVAGTIEAKAGRPWPGVGDAVVDGDALGQVVPRWTPTPVETADRAARLADARGAATSARADLEGSRAAYERDKAANAQGKTVSDRVVDEALAKVRSDEARVFAADATVKALEGPLATGAAALPPIPLVVTKGGHVVELAARPGESIEAGSLILRVAKFDRMLARVALVPGDRCTDDVTEATIEILGHEDAPIVAKAVRTLPSVDPKSFGDVLVFAVESSGFPLRAGMPLTARIARPCEAQAGVVVPRAAVVRYLGRPWAYVDAGEKGIVRRALLEPRRMGDGWFVTAPWKAGESVVTTGAMILLSEEIRAAYGGSEGD